ncbi:hypothetical protein KKC44_00400 [Patescibacteria group bacterium]|nr:hypothetical protein [Patescibacteria group bacterium]MBU2259046.1 hypothetical protein [Patescibacteria group bacterium]
MTIFLDLLSRSWKFFFQFKIPIFIGALLFTAVLLLVDGFFVQQEDSATREMMLRLGIDDERFEELDNRMKKGDEAAFDELLGEMEQVGRMFEEMPEEDQIAFLTDWSKQMAIGLLPMSFLMVVVMLFVYFLSSAYFYVLVLEQIRDPLVAARRSIVKVLPLTGVGIWMMLRSFMWVPGLDIFTGIYYLPRMVFAGVILLKEDRGVFGSVKTSMERTNGRWTQVVVQYIMLFALLIAASAIFAMAAGIAGPLKYFFLTFFGQLLFAFALVFTVFFAERMTIPAKAPAQSLQSQRTPLPD